MPVRGSYESWVELGYQLFSEEGHEGFQVDRLARILGKNKSSFYHYFPDKELFINSLINLHWKRAMEFKEQVKELEDFDPGFINVLLQNRMTILFHMNLTRNKDVMIFRNTYSKVNEFIDLAIVPLWAKHFEISESLAKQLFPTARDTFYSRLAKDIFTDEFVRGIVLEISEFMEGWVREKSGLPTSSENQISQAR